jgi:CP family cyanate transporter-like MFS transporter
VRSTASDPSAAVAPSTPGLRARPRRARTGFAVAAIVLIAFCSRGSFTSVGPLLEPLQRDIGLSPGAASVLVALPLVCFGLLAPIAPGIGVRLGLHRALLLGVALLGAGIVLRVADAVGLYVGTLLVGLGIALINVLLPAVTKADFPHHWTTVTALVTTAMTLSASLGAGLAQPLASSTGSAETSLLVWALPAVVAGLFWLPIACAPRRGVRIPQPGALSSVLKDPVGCAVAAYFGLQTLTFYSLLTWLPRILQEQAAQTSERAGFLVALGTALGVPCALVVPRLLSRRPSQVSWILAVSCLMGVAVLGLLVAPAHAPEVWVMLWGASNGASFPLAMSLIQLRTRDSLQTARLAAAALFAGYLLAATGPLLFGVLIEATGSWTPSLVVLMLVIIGQVAAGRIAGRPGLVSDD